MYDKVLYETTKHWRARQVKQRRIDQEKQESLKYYEEHKDEIETAKKAAFVAVKLAHIDQSARWLSVEDILCRINSIDELNFYYFWCSEVV